MSGVRLCSCTNTWGQVVLLVLGGVRGKGRGGWAEGGVYMGDNVSETTTRASEITATKKKKKGQAEPTWASRESRKIREGIQKTTERKRVLRYIHQKAGGRRDRVSGPSSRQQ